MNKNLPNINHKTVVFTKHAKERLDLRSVSEDMVIQVMRNPQRVSPEDEGKVKFIGKVMGVKVHAVCKPIPEENKWLVLTTWVRGEEDGRNFLKRIRRINRSTLYITMALLIIVFFAVVYYLTQIA